MDPERCWNRRVDDLDYCAHHKDFPNVGANLKRFIDDLGGLQVFCTSPEALLGEFFQVYYPASPQRQRPDVMPILQSMVAKAMRP